MKAITRLILAGVYDRHPDLKILLAHSGGVLPQLSSRLASCIHHDPVVAKRLAHDARYYLGKLWYDAVAYGSEELEFVAKTCERGLKMASAAGEHSPSQNTERGTSRILFGTDHPFFPPLEDQDSVWMSVTENLKSIEQAEGWNEKDKDGVRGLNALNLFDLPL
jgi:aminocarboxymuconate-semialdehyde decarboxylase